MELSHVRLLVDDFEACFRFYRDVMGMRPQADTPHGPYAKFTFADGPGAIALQQRSHFQETVGAFGTLNDLNASRNNEPRSLVAIKVADAVQAVQELRANGAEVTEARPAFGRMICAWLRDPEGNLIELQQWGA